MEANMALINNRYELIRIIGKGGFGTTWYARDTKLDMPVAVKELSDTDPSRKKKFLREARTLARFARLSMSATILNITAKPTWSWSIWTALT